MRSCRHLPFRCILRPTYLGTPWMIHTKSILLVAINQLLPSQPLECLDLQDMRDLQDLVLAKVSCSAELRDKSFQGHIHTLRSPSTPEQHFTTASSSFSQQRDNRWLDFCFTQSKINRNCSCVMLDWLEGDSRSSRADHASSMSQTSAEVALRHLRV